MVQAKLERKVVKTAHFDVVVVGGGIAGICAAVSASREGASVLLIEKGSISVDLQRSD